jgi:hypothetical protein
MTSTPATSNSAKVRRLPTTNFRRQEGVWRLSEQSVDQALSEQGADERAVEALLKMRSTLKMRSRCCAPWRVTWLFH